MLSLLVYYYRWFAEYCLHGLIVVNKLTIHSKEVVTGIVTWNIQAQCTRLYLVHILYITTLNVGGTSIGRGSVVSADTFLSLPDCFPCMWQSPTSLLASLQQAPKSRYQFFSFSPFCKTQKVRFIMRFVIQCYFRKKLSIEHIT